MNTKPRSELAIVRNEASYDAGVYSDEVLMQLENFGGTVISLPDAIISADDDFFEGMSDQERLDATKEVINAVNVALGQDPLSDEELNELINQVKRDQ